MVAGRSRQPVHLVALSALFVGGALALAVAAPVLGQSESPSPAPSSSTPVSAWTVTGSMVTPRTLHTATLLPDGRVLVAGGRAVGGDDVPALSSAELYDPATGTWTATGNMHYARAWHTATLLANGTVLVAGGQVDGLPGGNCPAECPSSQVDPSGAIAAAEIYDPSTGAWSLTGSMTSPRFEHTATLLDDGRVLVAGAELAPDKLIASTELYDPATGSWTSTGSLNTARWQQFAVKRLDGQVLIAGGYGPSLLRSVEIYGPGTGTWRQATDLLAPRAQRGVAVTLRDGSMLIAAGDGGNDHMLASAEIYRVNGGSTATGSMNITRGEPAYALLSDGRVLVVGGFDVPGTGKVLTSAEVFDPAAGTWSSAGDMSVDRFDFNATVLADGRVLVTGGTSMSGIESSAEIYDPAF
jgi:hypothetical protein